MADRNTRRRKATVFGDPVAGGVKIHKGTLVCLLASGFLAPANKATDSVIRGVAQDTIDNTQGQDGDAFCQVFADEAYDFITSDASNTRANIGKPVYAVDEQTVTIEPADSFRVGTIVDVEDDSVWITIG